jgi:hypothetical protein
MFIIGEIWPGGSGWCSKKISPTVSDGRANRDRVIDGSNGSEILHTNNHAILFCSKINSALGESCVQCRVHSHPYGITVPQREIEKKTVASKKYNTSYQAGCRGHELGHELNLVGNGLQGRQGRQGKPHCP